MSGKILGMLAVTAALGVLGTASAIAKDDFDKRDERGGFVLPCDLSGVNPVHHPDIFGNPAVARYAPGEGRLADLRVGGKS